MIRGFFIVAISGCCGVPNLCGAERPNVVVILADDQSYRDFGFMGNRQVHTPHLDQLAANASRYVNGYVPMSVCRPSLATILTGRYPHQHGIYFNHPPPGLAAMRRMSAEQYRRTRAATDRLIQHVPKLPRLLAEHGYACLQTGKHWEGDFRNAGFTHGMTLARPHDRISPVTGTRTQANGQPVAHGNGDAGLLIGRETMQPIAKFIAQHARRRPFLIWYAPFLPHTPFDAPQRFRDLYADRSIEPYLLPYYSEIARFDETVGQLISLLDEAELLDQTLIVFACDNGFRPSETNPRRQNNRSKLSESEDGLRTPLLLSWPGVIQPAEHTELVQTVDILPTVLAAVNLPDAQSITNGLPGQDLMPSARGIEPLPPRPAFGAIYPNDARRLDDPASHVRGRWIRSGSFKLVVPGLGRRPLSTLLYNLRTDPQEQANLAGDARLAATERELRRQLDQWWSPSVGN